MHKYYELMASLNGVEEVLFGSYDRSDCTYEIEAGGAEWKSEGYRRFRIRCRRVEEAPDPEVYS